VKSNEAEERGGKKKKRRGKESPEGKGAIPALFFVFSENFEKRERRKKGGERDSTARRIVSWSVEKHMSFPKTEPAR